MLQAHVAEESEAASLPVWADVVVDDGDSEELAGQDAAPRKGLAGRARGFFAGKKK